MNIDGRLVVRILVIFVVSILCVSLVHGMLSNSRRIPGRGEVVAIDVEVYADLDCTVVLDLIDWGRLYPGESRNTTFYVKLMGNTPSTLDLSTDNFAPIEAEQYLALTWDYDGHIVNPEDVSEVIVTLTVSSSIAGGESFSFDMIVTAYEVV